MTSSSVIQQRQAEEDRALGFWLYLMSDAILFALLFATYVVMVGRYADGPSGQTLFDLRNAFAETVLLLTSTLTFGLASVSAHRKQRSTVFWLAITFLLGAAFLVLELRELHGLIERDAGPRRSGFLSAFFTLIGTHGLHVAFGLFWIMVMIVQILFLGLTSDVLGRLQRLGLFWHFLDIVWIGIFSTVYLPGVI
jgi:cytochrome o ubiquinol oxidase subunit 3